MHDCKGVRLAQTSITGRLPKQTQTGAWPFKELLFSLKMLNVKEWCLLIRGSYPQSLHRLLKINTCSKTEILNKGTKNAVPWPLSQAWDQSFFKHWHWKKGKKQALDLVSCLFPVPQYIYLLSASSTSSDRLSVLPCEELLLQADSSFLQTKEFLSCWCCWFLYFKSLISWLKREKRKSRLWRSSQCCHFLTLSQSHELLMSIFPSVKPHKDAVKQN